MTVLLRGVRGDVVKCLQRRLGVSTRSGVYDFGTERAVRRFQRRHRLPANGIAGADTFVALGLYDLVMLRQGSKGLLVARLQEALGLDATGRFDRTTERALRACQAARGLKEDGLAGPDTLARLGVLPDARPGDGSGGGASANLA